MFPARGLQTMSRFVAMASRPHLRCLSTASHPASIVPVISLAPAFDGSIGGKEKVVAQIGKACEEIGFLTIVDHGVDEAVSGAMWDATWRFFDRPEEEKRQYCSENEEEYPYGYTPFLGEMLQSGLDQEKGSKTAVAPDLKECFAMGPYNPASGMPTPRLPTNPEDFAEAFTNYYKELEGLSSRLLSLMALALELPENWFEDKIDRHRCALRALNYPDLETHPEPGQIRASAHTDYGTVTILKPDAAKGGLQVLGKDNEWHSVPYMPNAYVINLGDLMARWTNDKWVSTLHRVVNPPLDASESCRRQSVAFFHNINADVTVECIDTCQDAENPPKYPPIKAFDFLLAKHLASMGK